MTDLPGLDLARFAAWFDDACPGQISGPLQGRLITGGRSNLTYEVSDGGSHWVVRRPPLGHVLATAHDMGREYRVVSALRDTSVPVPLTYALCADPSVLGAPFYVMSKVDGISYRTADQIAEIGPARTRAVAERMIDTLALLHAVPPAEVGLADFGRPEGFLARQVRRWKKQLDASRSRPVAGIDELYERLAANPPDGTPATIVHGDYRLDNTLIGPDDKVAAVVDWEMATLGDPLTDVGLLIVYQRMDRLDEGPMASAAPGYPSVPEVIGRYAERSGRDLSDLGFYIALATFKAAVIFEGIHFRYVHGQTVGEGFEEIGTLVEPLVASGLAAIREALQALWKGRLMEFAFDARTEELRAELLEFMDARVYPAEPVFREQVAGLDNRWAWTSVPVLAELRDQARSRGLWNLFLPGEHGAGLTNLQYAPLAEIAGRSPHLAPAALNCSAPDTGNMEVLATFGSPEQRKRWLQPLLDGEIRSSFAMTEPGVASSDATNIATRIERDGDEYVISGRKWWITGALNPQAEIFIVMGKTDPSADRHRQQSMILVPRDTPGVAVLRGMEVFGYDDHEHGGHAEIVFSDVRVPAGNLVGGEGDGFAIAQARLGPGRIHHCMRSIGLAERAIELMCARADSRVAFGKPLAEQGVIRDWIAEARVRIEQLRLLVLKAAWLMDTVGNKAAHTEIQAIKIATPATVEWIIDKAIQVHGAGGLSQDFPLASAFAGIRTLRFADGPDEVHKNALARAELRRQRARRA